MGIKVLPVKSGHQKANRQDLEDLEVFLARLCLPFLRSGLWGFPGDRDFFELDSFLGRPAFHRDILKTIENVQSRDDFAENGVLAVEAAVWVIGYLALQAEASPISK